MRIRPLVHDVRCALRVSRINCELSDADLAAMLKEAAHEIGGRGRTRQIIECTVMRAHHVCEAMLAEREAAAREHRRQQRKRSAGRRGVKRRASGRARS